jgi:hypothetical protein
MILVIITIKISIVLLKKISMKDVLEENLMLIREKNSSMKLITDSVNIEYINNVDGTT